MAPRVSVCIPTLKRLEVLKRAVRSVFAQTCQDWELVISDDEDPPGETWEYLRELPKQDSRVRVMQNPGPHGQVPNINRALLEARGAWIKPLHDDDVLRPECLETLLRATQDLPSVVMVSGLAAHYSEGRLVRNWRRRGRAPLELIEQRYTHLGMYLQDCNVGLPTQLMVHRKAIERGALFEEVPGVLLAVDVLWHCAVLRHGDLLFVNQVLVEYHQDRGTITSLASAPAGQIDAEHPILLRRELEGVDPSLKPPPLAVVLQTAKCIRALHRLKNREAGQAIRLFWQVRRARAWTLAARWVVNQAFPGVLHVVPRVAVNPREAGPPQFGLPTQT